MQNPLGPLNPLNVISPLLAHQENVQRRRKAIKSFKAKADAKRTPSEKFADLLTIKFGTVAFLALNFIWFAVWILINTDKIPAIKPFDPFPFGLLTMIVSLEAIGLAIIVLISQNREARVSELREEIELLLNTTAEGELTKLISLVALLLEKQGVKLDDPELKKMLKPIDSAEMIRQLEEELDPKSKK
jgi:uncharacterized membrane protein